MILKKYKFTAKIWLYKGNSAWHFVSLPKKISNEIRLKTKGLSKAWGSLKVQAKINETTWETSIFPNNQTSQYILPIKKSIRVSENLAFDQKITLEIKLMY